MDVASFVNALVSAGVYSTLFYVKKMQNQKFDKMKFLSTLAVGGFVGVTLAQSGSLDQLSFQNQMVAYMGSIAVVENVLKAGYRLLFRRG